MAKDSAPADATATNLTTSPDAEKAMAANGADVDPVDHPDATADQPITDPVADQTPMTKPVTDAPAFAGPKNDDMPTPAEQAAPVEAPEPLKGVEIDGPAPVLGAPIGVNPIVPQAADVQATRAASEPTIEVDPGMTGADRFVPMVHPDGGTSDAFEEIDGKLQVPHDMVETMRSHGFIVEIE